MALATLTKKGQVTIPKIIRQSLGLHQGDKIEFIIPKNSKTATIKPVTKRVDELFGKLHKPGKKTVSVEKMDAIVKDKMKDLFK